MKKYLYILSFLVLGALSACNVKEVIPESSADTVTFDMSVTIPDNAIATRGACADNPIIDHIYVATFGRQQYLNEYVKAIPVDASGNVIDSYATTNGTTYHFRVTLLATTSERHVHIIANGPTYLNYNTRDTDLMLKEIMTTGYDSNGNPQGAYWAYFNLPNGTASWDSANNRWAASAEATTALSDIKLIRNFARVKVLNNASDFVLEGFHVFRTESKGSIAMPTDLTGGQSFVSTEEYSTVGGTTDDDPIPHPVLDIEGFYDGFVPEGVALKDETATTGVTWYNNAYQYVYESVKDNTTGLEPFIILKGRLTTDEATKSYYYRIELTNDDATSYPIYRNVDYTITITAVASTILGAEDPADAVTCNGNVSTAVSSSLPELSDGFSGLYVLYTDKTFANPETDNKQVEFKYKYQPDINSTTSVSSASLTISSASGSGHAVDTTGASAGTWYTQTGPDSDGWYTVKYPIKPSSSITSEAVTTFKVTGTRTLSGHESTLFRYITVRLIPIQTFKSFTVTGTGTSATNSVTVSFGLPAKLPASMFPLVFNISDSKLALNPVGTDMPLVTHADGINYHFTKAVNWDDYKGSQDTGMTVTCNMFIVEDITSTEVSLSNEYFNAVTPVTYPSAQ